MAPTWYLVLDEQEIPIGFLHQNIVINLGLHSLMESRQWNFLFVGGILKAVLIWAKFGGFSA